MKLDKGMLFFTFTGMVIIILLIALTAAVATGPTQPATEASPLPGSSGNNEAPLWGPTNNGPEPAQPAVKTSNYPGFSTKYRLSFAPICYDGNGNTYMGRELTLNDNGTVTLVVDRYVPTYGTIQRTFTGGNWYKVKGKGHQIYLNLDEDYVNDHYPGLYFGFDLITDKVVDIVSDYGTDSFSINYLIADGSGLYSDWDAGYSAMTASADLIVPYIDSCVPADAARPYIERGYTVQQAVPYIGYNVPAEAAAYFIKQGVSADLCGPYIAAGVSKEDTVAYLNSGYTAEQIMPFVKAGVSESDAVAYLGAGATYDKARPYIGANLSASLAAPYAASAYSFEQCVPYINASINLSKAKAFLLLNIPSDQAVVYINNGILAMTAKPYVDAGVPAEKAVDEIKQGIPPTV